MGFEPDAIVWFNIAGGLALASLGVAVARRRPRRPVNLALAVYLASFGLAFVAEYTIEAFRLEAEFLWESVAREPFLLLAGLAAARLSFLVPGRRRASGATLAAAAVALLAAAAALPLWLTAADRGVLALGRYATWYTPMVAGWCVAWALLWFAALHIAFRFGERPSVRPADEAAVVIALYIWPAAVCTVFLTSMPTFGTVEAGLTLLIVPSAILPTLAMTVAWAFHGWRRPSSAARNAVLVIAAWFTVAVAAAGSLQNTNWMFGSGRLLAALWLTYAILRNQLLGLDVKVKWTLQKSTVAAIFIGVFVAVQTFVSETFTDSNGVIWGAVAAGTLVFAFNPLQRAAERLSDKAMPGVKPVVHMDESEKAFAYEQAARLAWYDGTVSKDERAMLDGLRLRLDLDAETAMRIESAAAT